ncbi:helicase-like transcription factor CHR28 isoform X2 [Malania oleifera]|uniref:helicase-like transcription factor CHR28 isoform X2 n=1 Tax=Malania oleifera TaxID=397392 RepID=UPI0025AEB894|nr:helicase-like transcription factor CHR28 isoform X2 [Malania oleifera]
MFHFFNGWICSLISRCCAGLVGLPFRNSFSRLIAEKENWHSAFVGAMDPIDISSSDSDWDIEDDSGHKSPIRESAPSNPRILPSWASTFGYDEQSQKVSSSEGARAPYERSSTVDNPSRARHQFNLNSNNNISASNWQSAPADDFYYSAANGNAGQPSNVLDIENFDEALSSKSLDASSGRDHRKILSHEALKRTLPSSVQPSVSRIKANNLVENVGSSQIRDTLGFPPARTSLTNNQSYTGNYFSRSNDDEVIMFDKSGSRVLPPSVMQGKSASTSQYASSSDPAYYSGIGEERAAENDERLIYQAALQDLNQPKIEANFPDGLLSVTLLRHQKIALAWMLQKETRALHCLGGILADDQGLGKTISMIALIQMQRSLQSKSKPEDQGNYRTEALNLDDDDDTGDAGLDNAKQSGETDDVKVTPEVSNSLRSFPRRRPSAGTLVVCPASVLRQWARELDEKVDDRAKLSILIYHGGNRTKDPVKLAKYDVVLTTYSIVTNEVPKQPLVDEDDVDQKDGENCGLSSEFSINKKRKKSIDGSKKGKKGRKGIDNSSFDYDSGPIARVGWFRVILDEAQTIKNHRTQVARACCGLRAKRRWCLSGTPIQNTIDDLYSYFRFLRYDPYAVYKSFYHAIKIPISRNSTHGYMKLQAILRAIMLRRTKDTLIDGEPVIRLPPKTVHLTKVDFSTEERAFYLKLEAESRSKFKAYAAAGTVNQNYANILLMLLRLRQACDHPLLVKGFNSESVGKYSIEMAKRLPKDMVINLLDLLETSLAICRVCSDPPEDAVVTMCGHVFCYQCVSEYLTGDENMCPAPECKEQLGDDVVFSGATLRSCLSDALDSNSLNSSQLESSLVLEDGYSSSKIRAVIKILQLHCKSKTSVSEPCCSTGCNGNSPSSGTSAAKRMMEDSASLSEGPEKAIVFSQWTSMLDLVEISLNQSCIQYRRLDGTMTLASRDRSVRDFNTDPEVTVLLMSLKAGNLGLNMVAACHVILLDLWWNPTTEDQAIDRAHRIGQTRPVTVARLTIKDTVEDRILALQVFSLYIYIFYFLFYVFCMCTKVQPYICRTKNFFWQFSTYKISICPYP